MNTKEIECLELFREKIKGENALVRFKTLLTDEFLLHFIHGRKFRVDYAFETLMQYFYVRHIKYRDFFLDTLPTQLRIKNVFGKNLKNLGPDGQLVIVSKREWWPPLEETKREGYTFDNVLQKFMVLSEEIWKIPAVHENGFEIIFDVSQVSFADVRWMLHVTYAIRLITLFHKAFPLRAKKIHLINPPSYISLVLNCIRPVDPAGLLKKVQSHHGDLKTLHDRFGVDILPEFLKGNLPEDQAFDEEFHDKAVGNDTEFLKLHKCLKKKSSFKRI